MKKLVRLLIALFVFYIVFEMLFNMFSKGYISEYKVDGFKVVEKRVKRTKGEIDNYYFEIFNDDLSFNIQTFKNLSKQENVIKEIKYFEDNNYKCILPITKQDIVFSDIVCKGNDGYYNYNTIEGKDSELDEFANSLSNYRTTFISSDKKAKSDSYITVYENLEDDFNLGLENYKGIYLVNKKYGFINNELFTKDIYTKDISGFVGNNYVVADYKEEYEFRKFYVVNIKTHRQTTITSDKKISMYSYAQGSVGNSLYILDTSNKVQYEVDINTKTVTIVGNESRGIKYYQNGEWTNVNMYEAINNHLMFNPIQKEYNGNYYERVDHIGGEKSGYYYVYTKNGNKYDAYRINVQNPDYKVYVFTTDYIDDIVYDNDYVFYKDENYIKYYSDLTGNKTLAKYDEVNFNKSLKLSFTR